MTSKPTSAGSTPAGTVHHGFAQDGLTVPTMVKPASSPAAPIPTTTATAPAAPTTPSTDNK